MSFLQPWAFLLLGLSVPLLLLYFLKVRRQQRRVSSVMLWTPVFRDQQASALFQRLQLDPLLLLQLLALLLLCAALARPTLTLQGQGAERLILVMDTSASMKARDAGSSRMREAQARAVGAGDRGGPGRRGHADRGGIRSRRSACTSPGTGTAPGAPSSTSRRATSRTT